MLVYLWNSCLYSIVLEFLFLFGFVLEFVLGFVFVFNFIENCIWICICYWIRIFIWYVEIGIQHGTWIPNFYLYYPCYHNLNFSSSSSLLLIFIFFFSLAYVPCQQKKKLIHVVCNNCSAMQWHHVRHGDRAHKLLVPVQGR